MANPTPLSPTAAAIAWAYDNAPEKETGNHRYHWLAAALRAAADQVVPPDPCGDDCCIDLSIGIRADFYAIAAELEGADG